MFGCTNVKGFYKDFEREDLSAQTLRIIMVSKMFIIFKIIQLRTKIVTSEVFCFDFCI